MTPDNFLATILPPLQTSDHTYFALALKPDYPPIQKRFHDISGVVNFSLQMSGNGYDTYYAMCKFVSPDGKRTRHNAFASRCVWADIDCGKENSVYPDKQAALASLYSFIQTTRLPPSFIIDSGRGIHVYWAMDRDIPSNLLHGVLSLFFDLCKQERLDVDPTRACDLASVLRVPGTIHTKTKKTVSVLLDTKKIWEPRELVEKIHASLKCSPTAIKLKRKENTESVSGDVAETLGLVPPPKENAENISRGCAQISELAFGNYNQRFYSAAVLHRCWNGLEWAQRLSAKNPSKYNSAIVEASFYKAANNAPTRCETFRDNNEELCNACKHSGKISSPIQLATYTESVPSIYIQTARVNEVSSHSGDYLSIPENWTSHYEPFSSRNFIQSKQGLVWIKTERDSNGEMTVNHILICKTQLWFKYSAHSYRDGVHKTIHYFDAILPNGAIRELPLVSGEDNTDQSILKWLHRADIYLASLTYKGAFMSFINAYLESIMVDKKTLPIVKGFGWTPFRDPTLQRDVQGFVVGKGIVTETGIYPVGHDPAQSGIFVEGGVFTNMGDVKKWKYVPDMYRVLNQPMGQFGMCLSFASCLMKYGMAEATNAYLNIFSDASGKGKTSLARAMFGIWGNPANAFGSQNASVSQRGRALSVWNNVTFCVDEITTMKDADMQSLVYILAGGQDKNRLKSDASFTPTGRWSTVTVSTANKSVKEALSRSYGNSDATFLRLIEFEWKYPAYDTPGMEKVQSYIREVTHLRDTNYGVAGPAFVHELLKHADRLDHLTRAVDVWRIKAGFPDNERFIAFAVGLALTAGRWACEWGFLDYDMDALEQWVLNELIPMNRGATRTLAPNLAEELGLYLHDRSAANTLVVKRSRRYKTDEPLPSSAALPDRFIVRAPLRELHVRYEVEGGELKLLADDFRKWCAGRGREVRAILGALKDRGIKVGSGRFTLGADTLIASARVQCYVLDAEALQQIGYEPPDSVGHEAAGST